MKKIPKNLLAQVLYRHFKETAEPLPAPASEHRLTGRVTVDVDCTLSKGADTEARPGLRPHWPSVLAYLLKRLGRPVEQVHATVRNALIQAAADQVDPTYQAAVSAALMDEAEKLEPAPRAGAIKVSGSVEIVSFEND